MTKDCAVETCEAMPTSDLDGIHCESLNSLDMTMSPFEQTLLQARTVHDEEDFCHKEAVHEADLEFVNLELNPER